MQFSIHLLPASSACFVLLQKDTFLLASPRYVSQQLALVAIERLLRQLRSDDITESPLVRVGNTLDVFESGEQPFLNLLPPLNEEEEQRLLLTLRQASTDADRFKIPVIAWQPTSSSSLTTISTTLDRYYGEAGQWFPLAFRRFAMGATPDQQFFFTVNDTEGIEVLFSDSSSTALDRDEQLMQLIAALQLAESYVEKEVDAHHFTIVNETGTSLATSRKYQEKAQVIQQIARLQARAAAWQFVFNQDLEWTTTKEEIIDFSPPKAAATTGLTIDTAEVVGGLIKTNPCTPLFHVMRPYGKADIDRFHGREQEVEELYERLFDTRLLVLYGEQAVGKTSLVQCGLANRIKASRYQGIFVRSWLDINKGLRRQIRKAVQEYVELGDEDNYSLPELLRLLYEHSFKPTLLVVDQLEKLFAPHVSEGQRVQFFNTIQALLNTHDYPLKVLLVVREEQLAKLADYDYLVPTLMDHRYHLQHLPATKVMGVVDGLLGNLLASGKIELKDPTGVSQKIKEKLAKDKEEVGLACMQVYLQETQQLTCSQTASGLPLFSPQVIDRMGDPKEVIQQYTQRRIAELEKQLPSDTGSTIHSEEAQELEYLVQTALDCGCAEQDDKSTWLSMWHQRGEKNRRLAALLVLSLFGLLLSALGMGWIYQKLQTDETCLTALGSTECVDWLTHLCQENKQTPCTEELLAKLNTADCPIWQDYRLAMQSNSCASYWEYIETYQPQGICVADFYQRLAQNACPGRVDTVMSVVRDTVVQQITSAVPTPPSYGTPVSPPSSDCDEIGGTATLRLGPLFMMTKDLNDGARYDWVGALNACRRKGPGWRLPCAGELEFILDKHYENAGAAFENLTSGSCPLMPRTEKQLSGSFWTATEANDRSAWSIRFDSNQKEVQMVFNTTKTTTMPCRCVYRDADAKSSMPNCLEKAVYRPDGE